MTIVFPYNDVPPLPQLVVSRFVLSKEEVDDMVKRQRNQEADAFDTDLHPEPYANRTGAKLLLTVSGHMWSVHGLMMFGTLFTFYGDDQEPHEHHEGFCLLQEWMPEGFYRGDHYLASALPSFLARKAGTARRTVSV